MKNTLGGITFEEFQGATDMPQKAASAWVALDGDMVGAGYKPLLYVGKQVVKGVNHWFIAEQTLMTATPERHIVKVAVNEFEGKFELVRDSIETIF